MEVISGLPSYKESPSPASKEEEVTDSEVWSEHLTLWAMGFKWSAAGIQGREGRPQAYRVWADARQKGPEFCASSLSSRRSYGRRAGKQILDSHQASSPPTQRVISLLLESWSLSSLLWKMIPEALDAREKALSARKAVLAPRRWVSAMSLGRVSSSARALQQHYSVQRWSKHTERFALKYWIITTMSYHFIPGRWIIFF